jgi:hypothetical protein
MDLSRLKQDLLDACLAEIDDRATSLKKVMEDAQQSANDYGQPKDRYDSYRTQLLRKRDMFGQQLGKILEQRSILERLDVEKVHNTVGFGSLVITNKQKIFVSVGIGKFTFNDEDFFVISPSVPFCKAMEAKKVGDSFEFRGQKFSIKNIR